MVLCGFPIVQFFIDPIELYAGWKVESVRESVEDAHIGLGASCSLIFLFFRACDDTLSRLYDIERRLGVCGRWLLLLWYAGIVSCGDEGIIHQWVKALLFAALQDVLGHTVEHSLGPHGGRWWNHLFIVNAWIEELTGTSYEWFSSRTMRWAIHELPGWTITATIHWHVQVTLIGCLDWFNVVEEGEYLLPFHRGLTALSSLSLN